MIQFLYQSKGHNSDPFSTPQIGVYVVYPSSSWLRADPRNSPSTAFDD